jgi:hypothetical protein
MAAASTGDKGPRCQPPSAVHRHVIVSTVALAELANAIPRSSYLFGVSWPDVRRTLLVAVEQNGDPYAVMIETFSAGRSGVFEEGVVKVHLCSEVGSCPDPSAPSAGRPKGARRARSLVSIAFIRKQPSVIRK